MPDNDTGPEITIRSDDKPVRITDLPPAVVQSLYHQATGKTEKLTRTLKRRHVIVQDDIKSLCEKLAQTFAQYNVNEPRCTITIRHHKGTTRRFSSLGKFLEYDKSITEPISSINVRYDLLISVPQAEKFQQYVINIGFSSKIFSRDDRTPFLDGALASIINSAQYSIEFVDYVVAQNIATTIENWHESTDEIKLTSLELWYGKNAGKLMLAMFAALFFATFYTSYQYISPMNLAQSSNFSDLAIWLLISTATTFGFMVIAIFFVVFLTRDLSVLKIPHFIKINRGDERNSTSFQNLRNLSEQG